MVKHVSMPTLLLLLCCVLLVRCSKTTSICEGKFRPCGDNKCCCSDSHAKCANFGKNLNYIPKFTDTITRLWFTNNSLPYISDVTFKNLTHIFREIHLIQNDIVNIDEDAFKRLKSMGILEISGNSKLNVSSLWNSFRSLTHSTQMSFILNSDGIQALDNDSFRYLRNSTFFVQKIHLANNKIEHLNISAFTGLNKLTDLDISMNKIFAVSQPVTLRSLRKLILPGNKISGYPNFLCPKDTYRQVEYFPNLEYLELSRNVISTINANSWNCLKNLQIWSKRK